MLRNKAQESSQRQNQDGGQTPIDPVCFNHSRFVQAVGISQFFELKPNNVGRNAAVTASKISWSNQALANKTALRQVFGFGFACSETRVPRRGWGGKGPDGSLIGLNRKRIFSIDSLNRTPVQSVPSKQVVNNYAVFGDFDAWVPEQQPSQIGKPDVNPGFSQKGQDRFGAKRPESNKGEKKSYYSHNPTGFGMQYLSSHLPSLTQAASNAGCQI